MEAVFVRHMICKLKYTLLQHPIYHLYSHPLIGICGPFRVASWAHVSWACWNKLKYLVETSKLPTERLGRPKLPPKQMKNPENNKNAIRVFGFWFFQIHKFLGVIFPACSFNLFVKFLSLQDENLCHKHQAGVKQHVVNRCLGFDSG